jgi:hypothetical protein
VADVSGGSLQVRLRLRSPSYSSITDQNSKTQKVPFLTCTLKYLFNSLPSSTHEMYITQNMCWTIPPMVAAKKRPSLQFSNLPIQLFQQQHNLCKPENNKHVFYSIVPSKDCTIPHCVPQCSILRPITIVVNPKRLQLFYSV